MLSPSFIKDEYSTDSRFGCFIDLLWSLPTAGDFFGPSGRSRSSEVSDDELHSEAPEWYITFGNCDQNELANIFQNYPQDCVSALSNLDLSSIRNGNVDAVTAAYRIICQPRCGNPIITFYNRCGFSQFTGIVRGLCSRNSAETSCYEEFDSITSGETQVRSNCNFQSSTCTAACQNALTNYGRSGCCINVFNTTSLTGSTPAEFQNSLWSGCGVNTPEFCDLQTSSLSSADAPKIIKVFIMLTLIAMAMLLL